MTTTTILSSPDLSSREDSNYELLPAVKYLTLPLGIRCMEVNVQEVDDAVRQFSKKGVDITSPSWKFPHVTLDKLDVSHVMNAFRAHKDLPDSQLYMELMELLIDRLYYAIMTSFEFVNALEAVFVNAGFQLEQGDKKKTISKQMNWDPLEIAKKSSEDNTPKPFHTANIGMLVRQFYLKMMGLENIVLNNLHLSKKQEIKGNETTKEEVRKRVRETHLNLRHSHSQTDEGLQDGCDLCYVAQNMLKYVADKIAACLKMFNEADSKISKTRLELKKDALKTTHRGALLRWMQAFGTDCDNIMNYSNILLDINVKYKDDIRALKEDLEIKEEQFEKKMNRSIQSLVGMKEELRKEHEHGGKISKMKDAAIIKSSELQKALQAKTKELDRLSQEREALKRSFNIAEELNLQIKSKLAISSLELDKYKKDLQLEMEEKENLSNQVRNLSEELAKAGQQVLKLRETSEKVMNLQEANLGLTTEIATLKLKLEKHDNQDRQVKKVMQEKQSTISYLEEELRKAYSKIELLTLYPDLNGPINAPMKTSNTSCIETMEMQIKSNQIRMEILRAQSERLTSTVSKLRTHMQSSKLDVKQSRNSLGSSASGSL